jgi:hypothetical protein
MSAEADITSVYRFILSLGTPHFILAQLGRIFGTFIKTSEYKVLRKDAQSVDLWVNVPGATPELWEDLAGSAETILRLTGTKEPLVTWKSSSAQPNQAEFFTSWR